MEARDSRSKIRPLPVDEIDGGSPQRRPEPVKKAIPLIGVAVAAVAFAVIALGLGPARESDVASATTTTPFEAESAPTTTTTAAPRDPLLREMLPVVADSLRFIDVTATAARVGEWLPDAPQPAFAATVNLPDGAGFNADGTRVVIRSLVRGGSAVIDDAAGGRPIFLNQTVTSIMWHPTDPDAIAWTAGGVDTPTVLKVAALAGVESHGVLTPDLEVELTPGLRLLAWGSWGFLLQEESGILAPASDLLLLDSSGHERTRLSGNFYASSDDGLLLLARDDGSGVAMPFLVEADLTETALSGLDIGAADFLLSGAGDWVIAVTPQADGHTSVLARTVRAHSTRLSSVRNETTVIGLVWEDRYVALRDVATGDIIFKDWNTGAEFHVAFPDAADIAALFL
jgi:hypothetical protein